jgi:hypothetical protein
MIVFEARKHSITLQSTMKVRRNACLHYKTTKAHRLGRCAFVVL